MYSLIWEPIAVALLYTSTLSQLSEGSTQLLKPLEMPTMLKSIGTLENKERELQKVSLTFKKKQSQEEDGIRLSRKLINAEYLYKLRKSLLPPSPWKSQ